MKQIDATEVIKTLNWISQLDEEGQTVLEPKLNGKGVYECIVHLPLIEKTVIGIGDTKLESIENVAKESSKLINGFLDDNPDLVVKNALGESQYVLEEDENGYLCIRMIQEREIC